MYVQPRGSQNYSHIIQQKLITISSPHLLLPLFKKQKDLAPTMAHRITTALISVHSTSPSTCEYVTQHCKRDFEGGLNLRSSSGKNVVDWLSGPDVIVGDFKDKRERQKRQNEGDRMKEAEARVMSGGGPLKQARLKEDHPYLGILNSRTMEWVHIVQSLWVCDNLLWQQKQALLTIRFCWHMVAQLMVTFPFQFYF